MRLLPKSIHRCRRYPTKFNSGRDIPRRTAFVASPSSSGAKRSRFHRLARGNVCLTKSRSATVNRDQSGYNDANLTVPSRRIVRTVPLHDRETPRLCRPHRPERRGRGSLSRTTPPLLPTAPIRGPFDVWQIRSIFGKARTKTAACSGPVRSAAVRTNARTRALTRACSSSSRRRMCRSLVRTIHPRFPTIGSQSASLVPAGNSD